MMRGLIGLLLLVYASAAKGETGYAAWLRYAPIDDANARQRYEKLPATVVTLEDSPVIEAARGELLRGVRGMLDRTLRIDQTPPEEDCIVLATVAEVRRAAPGIAIPERLADDAYILKSTAANGHAVLLVSAVNARGVLYGTFALLRRIALGKGIEGLDEKTTPYAPVRWTNEWDNLNGTIERGYAGRSIFFQDGNVLPDVSRVGDYARMLASVGINGCTVNNVNADVRVLTSEFLPQLARIADEFRPWGVRMSIAVDFSSPKAIGHLRTFDPLDPQVAAWWKQKVDEVYRAIPDVGGFVLKADSEGRVGPSTYGRTHADAANVIARALKPHGGVLVYRGFVYDHHMDWRNLKNDRARAAYDNFAKLDGQFDDNVLVQIKFGPIDFQVREPVSPLLGALKHTNVMLEVQVTQEYTGQQRHLCFLLPMWKQILDFDINADGATPIREIVSGRSFRRSTGGLVAVTNVGRDLNWLGSDLAMANLYAFGRIAWNPDLKAREIADEWTRQTFGWGEQMVNTIENLELDSWRTYENYTGSLGAGGLTDIIGIHYGPGIESSERNGWGQWHRADGNGIGMDRTVKTGTGYIGQYPAAVAAEYESLEKCPDELLLFMHHVPYRYTLHSGKTVIQHIYDSHYEGAAEAQTYPEQWRRLHGQVDEERYGAVLRKLEYQAGHAIVWRDAVCNWFYRESGIADEKARVGSHPNRREAETMALEGYAAVDVRPWEDASGGKAAACSRASCTATSRFAGADGWYDLAVQYFDQNTGMARFDVSLNGQPLDSWKADDKLPSNLLDSHTSTRETISGVALRAGDEIRVTGFPDSGDQAAIDYIEITPTIR